MKIYVDGELPKECFDCPCFRNDIEICCGLDDGTKDYHKFVEDSTCPLETTQSLKQQVREEVVEEIKAELNKQKLVMKSDFRPREEEAIPWEDIVAILYQVKGERNVKD